MLDFIMSGTYVGKSFVGPFQNANCFPPNFEKQIKIDARCDATHLCKNSCLKSHETILLLRELETDYKAESCLSVSNRAKTYHLKVPNPLLTDTTAPSWQHV